MPWSLWFALVGAGVLISLTPGAGAINTMANSLAAGWSRAWWGVLGLQLALVVHILVVALGVGVLVANTSWLFNTIRFIGAGYLIWLGIRQWSARPMSGAAVDAEVAADRAVPAHLRPWAMVRRGLFVNLTNPKAILFFLAFTPQFVRPERPLLPQYLVYAATLVAIDTLVMGVVFGGAAKALRRFLRDEAGQRTLGRAFGSLFVLVGAGLAAFA